MKIILWLIFSIASAILYRIGGKGGFPNAKLIRRLGCPLVSYGYLLTLWQPADLKGWGLLLLTFGLTFGAISTYFDTLFGQDSHYAHGFAIGIACLPLFWAGIPLWLILARSLVLGLFMGIWSKLWGWDLAEELGRGAILCISVPILLI